MNTKNFLRLCRRTVALLALVPLASRASDTTESAKDPATEPPTHVLFTGTDIRVLYEGKLHPVRDVDGSSLVIRFTDTSKILDLPLATNAKKLVLARVQTLADRTATLANFKYERAYTQANDPHRQATEGMLNALALAENARRLQEMELREPEKITTVKTVPGGYTLEEIDNPLKKDLQNQLQIAQGASGGNMGTAGYYAGKMAEEQAQELYDALEMQFELTSDTPLQAAYMVVVVEYHTKERPKDSETWVLAKSLGAIDSGPRKVWLCEGGLPKGYVLEKVRVHLYEDGVEIATDLSENRASLTRDEAHEYLVLDHMSTHKADTTPARIALTKLPEDWTTRPRDESFRKTFFVQVDKSGRPIEAFEDEACTKKVSSPYFDSVLKDQLFFPALEKGTPVDSVVRVKVSKLSS